MDQLTSDSSKKKVAWAEEITTIPELLPFTRLVDRSRGGSLKKIMTPPEVAAHGLLSYWGAEFEFPTAPAFCRGVERVAQNGLFAFTMQTGAYSLRVCEWIKAVRGWSIAPNWVVPTHGTIFGLATTIRLFVGKHSNIIVMPPFYSRYAQAAERLGRGVSKVPLLFEKETGRYCIDREALEKAFQKPQNRLLVLTQPNNPTGTIFSEEELRFIAKLSEKYAVPVFSDEIFAEVVLGQSRPVPYGKVASTVSESPLAITATSLGKCMSLTGVNHANLIISNPKLKEIYNKQKYADHYGSIDPMLYAGLMEAYSPEGKVFVDALCVVVKRNAERLIEAMKTLLPKARFFMPEATYVIWADYRGLGLDDEALRDLLCRQLLFVGDPGRDYGFSDQFYRYNLAVPPAEIEKSVAYMESVLSGKKEEAFEGDVH